VCAASLSERLVRKSTRQRRISSRSASSSWTVRGPTSARTLSMSYFCTSGVSTGEPRDWCYWCCRGTRRCHLNCSSFGSHWFMPTKVRRRSAPRVLKTCWRSFGIGITASHRAGLVRRSCSLSAAGTRRIAPQLLKKSHGSGPPGEGTEYRSCPSRRRRLQDHAAPDTASFEPGITGRLCVCARSWTDPTVAQIFNSHIRSQSGQTRTNLRSAIVRRARVEQSVVGKHGVTRGLR
jgi:hypothetical protein